MDGRAMPANTLCQTRYLSPVAAHHSFLFLAAPTLDLSFGGQCLYAGGVFLTEHQFDGQAPAGVAVAQARLMFAYALFEVVGVSGVV
jgi:hypothetical protein